jgi:hypothetical protein
MNSIAELAPLSTKNEDLQSRCFKHFLFCGVGMVKKVGLEPKPTHPILVSTKLIINDTKKE